MQTEFENNFFYSTKEYKEGSIPDDAIADCSGSGDVTESVKYWVKELDFDFPESWGLPYLEEFGWENEELEDHEENKLKVFWLACGEISDKLCTLSEDKESSWYGMLH
jgi:hypothetical protein